MTHGTLITPGSPSAQRHPFLGHFARITGLCGLEAGVCLTCGRARFDMRQLVSTCGRSPPRFVWGFRSRRVLKPWRGSLALLSLAVLLRLGCGIFLSAGFLSTGTFLPEVFLFHPDCCLTRMPGSLTSDESFRASSLLSTPPMTMTLSTAASSRATSPLPIPYKSSRDPHRATSPPRRATSPSRSRATSPQRSRATSPSGKPKSRRPSVSRHATTPPRMDGLLSRVLAEEDKYITRLRDQITELAGELRVRTDALEQAYERVQNADKRTVETHKKYLAEAAARSSAEGECRRAQEETRKVQVLLDVARAELERTRDDVERLEAERAEAESVAGRAKAVARELKKVGRREGGEGDRQRDRQREDAMAAAIKAAYERGKAEGEASATMKALAAFDKLMESDELAGWDEDSKLNTRQEIKASGPERAKSPNPPKKWGMRRGSNSGN